MIKLIQFDGVNVTPQDDGAVFDQALGSGIFFGCVVSATGGNQLTVTAGRGIASGRSFSVEQETINATTSQSGSVQGRLLIEIDISNSDTPIKFVTQAQSPLPALTQQNLNNGGTVYQLPLATYTVDAVQVSGLQNIDNSIVLPPEKGGTGEKSLDNITVGNSNKLGGILPNIYAKYLILTTGSIDEFIDEQPTPSAGIIITTSGMIDGPVENNYGGIAYYAKNSDISARVSWISTSGSNAGKTFYKLKDSNGWKNWGDKDVGKWGGYKNWVGSQAQYNTIVNKDQNTWYAIVG